MQMHFVEQGKLVTEKQPDTRRFVEASSGWCWLALSAQEFKAETAAQAVSSMELHNLARLDASRQRHAPKFEHFDRYSLLILREDCSALDDQAFTFASLPVFWDGNRMLTISHSHSSSLERLYSELEQYPLRYQHPLELVVRLARIVNDEYMARLLATEQRLDDMEEGLVENRSDEFLQQLLQESTMLKRMARSLRYQQIAVDEMYEEFAATSEHNMHQLQDALENIDRAATMAQMLAEIAVDLMNAFLSLHAHRLNRIMQILTVLTAVFLPLTLIAGIYGMNFDHMPELHWKHGYFAVLGIMVTCVLAMVMLFRRLRWV